MIHDDYYYTDVTRDGQKKRTILPVGKYSEWSQRLGNKPIECHRSLYRFPKAFLSYSRENGGSTAGYSGPCYADYLPIEIDRGAKESDEGLEESCAFAEEVYEILTKRAGVEEKFVRLFYSGNRGIHVTVPMQCFGLFEPDDRFCDVLFDLAVELFKGTGYIEHDDKYDAYSSEWVDLDVYAPQHMLRIPNTLHGKTNRFKVPVKPSMLADPELIRDISQNKRPSPKIKKPEGTESSLAVGQSVKTRQAAGELRTNKSRGGEDTSAAISALMLTSRNKEDAVAGGGAFAARKRAYSDILEGGMEDGEVRGGCHGRRAALLKLCGYFKNRRLPADVALRILRLWNQTHNPPMEARRFRKTFKTSAYGK